MIVRLTLSSVLISLELRNNRTIFPCEVKKIREKRGREGWKNFREDVDNKFLAECGGGKSRRERKKERKRWEEEAEPVDGANS